MISILDNNKIDITKWDACVEASGSATPYGTSWFLNNVCDGWLGLILNDYQAVMPLVASKKYGINYIYQPSFFQRTAIYSRSVLDKSSIANFYAKIPSKYKLHEFAVNETSAPPEDFGYEIIERPNLLIDLSKPYEELKTQFNSNTKRKLKKAQNYNLEIVSAKDPKPMIQAYMNNRGKIHGLSTKDINHLRQLINYAIASGKGQILEAYTRNNEFAGGIFILSALKRNILLFMGANCKAKETGALIVLIDYFLKKKANSYEIFDFEGSSDAGVAQFYKGFGAREEKYYSLKKDDLNKLIRFAKKIKR